MFDIVTIGSATRDNFLSIDYKLIDWPDTPEKKALALPFGEKLEADDVFFTIGGNAVNASVTFARQGFKTACVAKLGSDFGASDLKDRLKKEGVNTKFMASSKELPTAYSVLLLEKGERTIISYPGASHTLSLDDLNLKKLKSKWWYVSLSGESHEIYSDLVRFAKENNIKIAFNPTGHHLKHKKEQILESLKDLTFLVLNEGEAATLTGISFNKPYEVFKALDEMVPGIVAVTSGDKGVTVSDGKNIYTAGIFPEQKIADRTGAGDSFGSGFVAGLLRGEEKPGVEDIKYAIRLASANATSVVESLGASEGALMKKDFEKNSRWQDFNVEVKSI